MTEPPAPAAPDLDRVIGEIGALHLRERGRLIRERDALAATVARVRDLCDEATRDGDDTLWLPSAKAALNAPATEEGT